MFADTLLEMVEDGWWEVRAQLVLVAAALLKQCPPSSSKCPTDVRPLPPLISLLYD